MTALVRHRGDARWSVEDRRWLASDFEVIDQLSAAASMENFAAIIRALRARSNVQILILNVSSIAPGEMLHGYQGREETPSFRIKDFNVGLIRLSQETGISIRRRRERALCER